MTLVDELVDEWELQVDGSAVHGSRAVVVPVRTADGSPAVVKVGHAEHEHLVLRRWGGAGAVRLLRADPYRRALLLERAGPSSLKTLSDVDACSAVVELYRALHVPAMPQLPSLSGQLVQWADELSALPRSAPVPHRLVEQAVALCRELSSVPDSHVLHGNLHYGKVLAGERSRWLAIAPRAVNGDPAYEIAPMLWHRWDELGTGRNVRFGVQRRFFALVDAAGFDEDRARAWVVVRVVREATRDPSNMTKYVALVKAVQE